MGENISPKKEKEGNIYIVKGLQAKEQFFKRKREVVTGKTRPSSVLQLKRDVTCFNGSL